VVSVVPPG